MKFKSWEHLTNGLITLTLIGIGITWLVQTTYAARYRTWFRTIFIPTAKKTILKAYEVVEKLTPNQKEVLLTLATKHAKKGANEILRLMKSKIEIDDKTAEKLLLAGSKKIKDIIKSSK